VRKILSDREIEDTGIMAAVADLRWQASQLGDAASDHEPDPS
jgi:hypothetical protein